MLGPFDSNYAKRNDITLHMLFGVPKPVGSTRHILKQDASIRRLLDGYQSLRPPDKRMKLPLTEYQIQKGIHVLW